jgi:hypothetical protein
MSLPAWGGQVIEPRVEAAPHSASRLKLGTLAGSRGLRHGLASLFARWWPLQSSKIAAGRQAIAVLTGMRGAH